MSTAATHGLSVSIHIAEPLNNQKRNGGHLVTNDATLKARSTLNRIAAAAWRAASATVIPFHPPERHAASHKNRRAACAMVSVEGATVSTRPGGNEDPTPQMGQAPVSRVETSVVPASHVFGQNIRLASYVAKPVERSRNYQAVGDRCVGLHLMQSVEQ